MLWVEDALRGDEEELRSDEEELEPDELLGALLLDEDHEGRAADRSFLSLLDLALPAPWFAVRWAGSGRIGGPLGLASLNRQIAAGSKAGPW